MIKICNDRSVFPNSVKISNQYENDTRSIDFDLEDVQFTGNTYLICKYQNEDEYYAPLLLDSNNSIPVKTFLSQRAGMYECLIIISNVKIDENYDFSNDNPLFVSNLFNIYINKNYLNGTAKQWELSSEMKNYYDRLIALVDKVQEDLNNGTFNGNGIKNIMKTGSVGLVDTYQILFTNSSTFDFQVTNGATPAITIQNGVWFVNGISTGVSAKGEKGNKGEQGKSAYQVAVDNGFEGTEEEWMESLKYYNSKEFAQLAEQIREDANTASSASQSAAQSKKSVDETVAQFNSDYTAKVNDFYKKVTDANTDLDTKLGQANTAIDTKIQEATEQAQKATDEANRAEQATDGKLDKNLGAENSDKVIITDAEGNIITQNKEDFEGGGTSDYNDLENKPQINGVELKGNKTSGDLKMYTQEEVDYLLADKMDKPYVPITITDNATITDALEGNFKIDKIKGNTYSSPAQNVETDIVPTPDRAVPINSRKVKAGDEYVELRSLKETINQFDLGLLSQVDLIPDDGNSYRKIKIPIKLKPQVRYNFYYENFMIPGLSWLVLNIINSTGNIIFTAFNVNNSKNNEEIEVTGRSVAFNAPSDGEVYFSYYAQLYNSNGVGIRPSIEMFKENWFTKYVKNIMITEESLNQNTYVPPTVRDYKIVDHTNKTSKIIRNIQEVNLNNLNFVYNDTKTDYSRFYTSINPPLKYAGEIYSNVFTSNPSYNYTKEAIYGGNTSGGKTISITVKDSNVAEHTQEALLAYIDNPNAIVYYALETPTEETISYVETDTSEVGYSWQDSTSPSPTIKSEVRGVEEIDILKTGKNLLNEALLKNSDDYDKTLNPRGFWEYILYLKPNTKYTISRENTIGYQLGNHIRVGTIRNNFNSSTWFVASHANNENKQAITITTNEDGIVVLYFNNTIELIKKCLETIGYLQLELGDTATAYEPYQGQRVNITLPQPMYGNYDGSICGIADVEGGNYDYYMSEIVFDGSNDENWEPGTGIDVILNDTVRFVMPIIGAKLNLSGFTDTFKNFYGQNINNDVEGVYFETPYTDRYFRIRIKKDRLETIDVAGFKKWLKDNPIKLTYATNIKTSLPIPKDDLAKLKSLKTSAGVNNIFINGEVKPSIEARYPKDLVLVQQQLEQKILLISDSLIDTQAKVLLQGGDK